MGYQEVFGKAFAGRTVWLSGGTSGIGLALAKGFADCGADVIAAGSSEGPFRERPRPRTAEPVLRAPRCAGPRRGAGPVPRARRAGRAGQLPGRRATRRRMAGGDLPRRHGHQPQQRDAPRPRGLSRPEAAARQHRQRRLDAVLPGRSVGAGLHRLEDRHRRADPGAGAPVGRRQDRGQRDRTRLSQDRNDQAAVVRPAGGRRSPSGRRPSAGARRRISSGRCSSWPPTPPSSSPARSLPVDGGYHSG